MSLREEDRQNKNCPSRGLGLGLAAAAIGVGVGAALYYFISKRPENPNTSGATEDWTSSPDQALNDEEESHHESSFTTISAHSTSDTSIHASIETCSVTSSNLSASSDSSDDLSETSFMDISDDSSNLSDDSRMSVTEFDENTIFTDESENSFADESSRGVYFVTEESDNSFSDETDRALTEGSDDVFADENRYRRYFTMLSIFLPRSSRVCSPLGHSPSRERTWSLEECSICFDVILRDQEVMSLPCTHHFHTKCILPWLQEQQTCPNCRKAV